MRPLLRQLTLIGSSSTQVATAQVKPALGDHVYSYGTAFVSRGNRP